MKGTENQIKYANDLINKYKPEAEKWQKRIDGGNAKAIAMYEKGGHVKDIIDTFKAIESLDDAGQIISLFKKNGF